MDVLVSSEDWVSSAGHRARSEELGIPPCNDIMQQYIYHTHHLPRKEFCDVSTIMTLGKIKPRPVEPVPALSLVGATVKKALLLSVVKAFPFPSQRRKEARALVLIMLEKCHVTTPCDHHCHCRINCSCRINCNQLQH